MHYALKKVKLTNLSEREKYNALQEVRILASIRQPNVIGYKEVFLEPKTNSLWYASPIYLILTIYQHHHGIR